MFGKNTRSAIPLMIIWSWVGGVKRNMLHERVCTTLLDFIIAWKKTFPSPSIVHEVLLISCFRSSFPSFTTLDSVNKNRFFLYHFLLKSWRLYFFFIQILPTIWNIISQFHNTCREGVPIRYSNNAYGTSYSHNDCRNGCSHKID